MLKNSVIVGVIAIAAFLAGVFLVDFEEKEGVPETNLYQFVNEARIDGRKFKASTVSTLEEKLIQTLEFPENKNIIVALYYRDLNNGPWFSFHATETFEGASLFKIPVMLAYFKAAESDPFILEQKIRVALSDEDEEVLQHIGSTRLQDNEVYSVRELIEIMIIDSDNYATFLLLDHSRNIELTPDADFTNAELGLEVDMNDTNIVDFAGVFRILYNTEFLDPKFSEEALKILTQTEYNAGIKSLLPKNVVVAHKFGIVSLSTELDVQLHDCGIVYVPESPYLLCIMTKGSDLPQQEQLLAEISKMFYEIVTQER